MKGIILAVIRDVLIISTEIDSIFFKELLGDGSQLGMKFFFEIQDKAGGIAEAFIIGENFIKDDKVCLVLGDNLFYGQGFTPVLEEA